MRNRGGSQVKSNIIKIITLFFFSPQCSAILHSCGESVLTSGLSGFLHKAVRREGSQSEASCLHGYGHEGRQSPNSGKI
jgi:hypothetical protein